MLFTRSTYVGVDPSAGQYAIAYAALDGDLQVMALGQGGAEEVLAYLGGQDDAVVALNAPPRPNRGLLKDEKLRARFSPSPPIENWKEYRLAEYQLASLGIRVFHTPSRAEDCTAWMRAGLSLHRRLKEIGYTEYPAENAACQIAEAWPYASYCAWLGLPPFRKYSLEGRLQRQLVLYDFGLDLPNPMRFFEEITRHRLLQGELPDDVLFSAPELDALANAYTAWHLANHPEQATAFGDPEEGQVLLPTDSFSKNSVSV